jgi:hypothetical protein
MSFLFPSTNTDTKTIDTPSTPFISVAGFSAAAAAIVAAAISVLQGLDVLNVTEPVKIALLGLVGAGLLAWAIAAAGDSLARAYAVAHVTRTPSDQDNKPAIQAAAIRLADAYAAAHGLKPNTPANPSDGGVSATTTSVYSPVSPTTSKEYCFELSSPLGVKVHGKDAQAVAVLISGESGKETQRYLIGLPGSPLSWMNSDAISMPDAAPPAALPAAQPPSPTTSQECCLEFSPPLNVKVGAKDGEAIAVQIKSEGGKETQRYLVRIPGSRYSWVVEDAISMRMS